MTQRRTKLLAIAISASPPSREHPAGAHRNLNDLGGERAEPHDGIALWCQHHELLSRWAAPILEREIEERLHGGVRVVHNMLVEA